MIRRIILENYMAHVRTVIEPAEGLTVLIGPNNCGKSAVIHALEMICYNSDAADFAIRHGTKKATVTVETEDEDGVMHTLVWWRSKSTAGYSVDGREISGLGRNVPYDLHDHLLMPKIEPSAGGEPFLLHFGFQKSPIFLLDDPASRAAHFFASSSDADKLLEMQKRHAQKSSAAKRDKKLDDRLEDLDKQLEILSPLPEISQRLNQLEADHLKLVAFGESLESLEQSIDEFARATDREEASAMRLRTLAMLRPPPVLHEVFPVAELVRSMAGNQLATEQTQAASQVLVHLKAPPVLHVTTALSLLCRQMEHVGTQHDMERSRSEAVAPLAAPPVPHDTAALRQLIGAIARAAARARQSEAYNSALDGLAPAAGALHDIAPMAGVIASIDKLARQSLQHHAAHLALADVAQPPAMTDLIPLRGEIERLEKARQLEADCRAELRRAGENVAGLRLEIEQWVEEHPRCTTCGQAVSAELIFSGGHDHG